MSFIRSRYTLAEPWPDGRGLLVNAFSGAVDVVSDDVVSFVRSHREAELADDAMLLDRGYYVESREVEEAIARRVAERAKAKARETGIPKYMFAVTLGCNLACKYCWQVIEHGNSRQATGLMRPAMADAAFAYIDRDLLERGRDTAFISLFGGEPLIDAPNNRAMVRLIGDRTKARGMHLHFTTNGRDLAAYREEVALYEPSIQITIDGAAASADGSVTMRRDDEEIPGLYELIAELCLGGHAEILVRFLVNESTVPEFVALADAVFTDPRLASHFTLAVAPLQNKTDVIDPEIPPKFKILSVLMDALRGRSYAPKIAYIDWRSLNLFEGLRLGEELLPNAAFYHCEANVDLTCFDYRGRLYACYEAIGNQENAIGTYWPEVKIDTEHLAQYRDRSAFSMPECTACALSPVCGGGCEVRGYKKNGTYMHPYCDALHAEARQTMRRWPELATMLVGENRGY